MDDAKLEEWEKQRGAIIERQDVAKEDALRAEFHCYRDLKTNELFIPSEHFRGAMIGAGGMQKSKVGNAKKSMKNVVAAMFFVFPEKIKITPQEYEIDKRSAVNRAIKARVISIRPKWPEWTACFELQIDNDTITKETAKKIVEDAGNYIGIGSFRPEHNGMFGRYTVESFTLK